jgi:hypothetical protein
MPVLAAAAAAAGTWRVLGDVGALAAAALVAGALLGWAGWGAPAWRSRLVGRLVIHVPPRVVVLGLLVAPLAVVASALGVAASEHSAAVASAWVAAGLGELAIAMTAAGVRQWRFAPWPRRAGFVTTIAASVLLVALGVPLTARGSAWGPIAVAITMVVIGMTARAPARRLRATGSPEITVQSR